MATLRRVLDGSATSSRAQPANPVKDTKATKKVPKKNPKTPTKKKTPIWGTSGKNATYAAPSKGKATSAPYYTP